MSLLAAELRKVWGNRVFPLLLAVLAAANLLPHKFYLILNKVFHVPVWLCLADVKDELPQRFGDVRVFFRHGVHRAVLFIIERIHRQAGGFDFVAQTNLDSVHFIIGAAVCYDAADIGQRKKLLRGNIIVADFTVNAERTDGAGHVCIAGTAKVDDCNHILLHDIPPFSYYAGLRPSLFFSLYRRIFPCAMFFRE